MLPAQVALGAALVSVLALLLAYALRRQRAGGKEDPASMSDSSSEDLRALPDDAPEDEVRRLLAAAERREPGLALPALAPDPASRGPSQREEAEREVERILA